MSPTGPLMPETIGKYRLRDSIGRGGMGMIFRAHDPVLDRLVALKVISPEIEVTDELRARFFREAKACAKLNHPNIVTVFDMGEDAGRLFIVMELLEGQDLRHLIRGHVSLTLDEKLSVMRQVCHGLYYAHQNGVVHRDMKPGNIFLLQSGGVKILDFGIAHMATSQAELTKSGLVMGTLRYVAPEQLRGRADQRSDMFSVGGVFYELLTARPPFQGDDPMQVLEQLRTTEPPLATEIDPGVPLELSMIVRRAMQKDPAQRFRDLEEMGAEIQAVAERAPEPERRHDPPPSPDGIADITPKTPGLSSRMRWPVVAAAAVALAGGVGLVYWRSSPAPPSRAPEVARSEVTPTPPPSVVTKVEDKAAADTAAADRAAADKAAADNAAREKAAADKGVAERAAAARIVAEKDAAAERAAARKAAADNAAAEKAAADKAAAEKSAAARAAAEKAATQRAATERAAAENATTQKAAAERAAAEKAAADRSAASRLATERAAAERAAAEKAAAEKAMAEKAAAERVGAERAAADRAAAEKAAADRIAAERAAAAQAAAERAAAEKAAADRAAAEKLAAERAAAKAAADQAKAAAPKGGADVAVAVPPPASLGRFGSDGRGAIQQVLDEFRRAYEAKDLATIQRIRPTLRADDLRTLRSTFDNATTYSLDLKVETIELRGNEAQARVLRQDVMVARDGQIYRSQARVTIRFQRAQDRWTIDDIR